MRARRALLRAVWWKTVDSSLLEVPESMLHSMIAVRRLSTRP